MTNDEKGKLEEWHGTLSLTHMEGQGGAANRRNVSLLMKGDKSLTEEQKELLKSVLGEKEDKEEFIEKMSFENKRNMLSKQIKKFEQNEYSFSFVEDFDENFVVFSNDAGLFYTTYEEDEDSISVGSDAFPVNKIVTYTANTDSLEVDNQISVGRDDNEQDAVRQLVERCVHNLNKDSKLMGIFKSKYEKGKLEMDEKIEKALAPVQEKLNKALEDIEAITKERDEAKEKLQAFEKAAKEQKDKERLEIVKSVVVDEKEAEELYKSIEGLEDEGFNAVISALKAKKEKLEKSDDFKQLSGNGVEGEEKEDNLTSLLKARYTKE